MIEIFFEIVLFFSSYMNTIAERKKRALKYLKENEIDFCRIVYTKLTVNNSNATLQCMNEVKRARYLDI